MDLMQEITGDPLKMVNLPEMFLFSLHRKRLQKLQSVSTLQILQGGQSVCVYREELLESNPLLILWPLMPQKGKESTSPIKIRLLVVIK